jgi:hypothetical protein
MPSENRSARTAFPDGTYLYVISRSTFISFFRKGWVVDDVFWRQQIFIDTQTEASTSY